MTPKGSARAWGEGVGGGGKRESLAWSEGGKTDKSDQHKADVGRKAVIYYFLM